MCSCLYIITLHDYLGQYHGTNQNFWTLRKEKKTLNLVNVERLPFSYTFCLWASFVNTIYKNVNKFRSSYSSLCLKWVIVDEVVMILYCVYNYKYSWCWNYFLHIHKWIKCNGMGSRLFVGRVSGPVNSLGNLAFWWWCTCRQFWG